MGREREACTVGAGEQSMLRVALVRAKAQRVPSTSLLAPHSSPVATANMCPPSSWAKHSRVVTSVPFPTLQPHKRMPRARLHVRQPHGRRTEGCDEHQPLRGGVKSQLLGWGWGVGSGGSRGRQGRTRHTLWY